MEEYKNYKNGIKDTDETCRCGAKLRLHTYIFDANKKSPKVKFYYDCKQCGFVTDWLNEPELDLSKELK